jgi:hypothetical protein
MVARDDATGGFCARAGATPKTRAAVRAILNGVIANLQNQREEPAARWPIGTRESQSCFQDETSASALVEVKDA